MTEFIRSYTRAIRSNIARTCGSERVPAAEERVAAGGSLIDRSAELLERGDVVDQLVELLGLVLSEARVGGHRRGGVHEGACDGVSLQPLADLGERRPERVAVLADLVAAEAARRRRHLLALLELGRRLQLD